MTGVIAHEWIERLGGAEKVVDALAQVYPDAPIVCAWNDAQGRYDPSRVHESWLARTPMRHHKALAIPFMLETWRHIPIRDAEWVLCSSHLFAHHARLTGAARDVPKYVFAHTPARYIWEPEFDARGGGRMTRAAAIPLQRIDRKRAQEALKIAAVSRFIADRIERCWERESTIIHPPVDVAGFAEGSSAELAPGEYEVLASLPKDFVLGASRFVSYKRLDVAIATGVAAGLPVVLAGDGPDRGRLESIAAEHPGSVTFVPRPSTALLRELYLRALVFVFASIEDFGIMPVEAMSTGTPVVANAIGGASETVLDGLTGAHIRSEQPAELRRALEVAASSSSEACRARAWEFDGSHFGPRISAWMA
jgi:glycosyltransferase involved in cell wall biosynthesis